MRQLKQDLQYIKDTYGEVYDYCGGWCNCDLFEQLLNSPNQKIAKKILITKLRYYFDAGYIGLMEVEQLPVETDERLQEIKARWNINKEAGAGE